MKIKASSRKGKAFPQGKAAEPQLRCAKESHRLKSMPPSNYKTFTLANSGYVKNLLSVNLCFASKDVRY
jgi:hypothetical protein